MADAIGQVLSLGVGVALSPIPIIAVVLMLSTPRARANGPAFVLGWVVGLAVVGAIVAGVAGGAGANEDAEPATWVDVLKLVLGVLLLLVAVRQWRGRPRRGAEAALPAGCGRSTLHPGRSLAIAAALSGINPKNLLLTVGAAAAIAQTGVGTGAGGDRARRVRRSIGHARHRGSRSRSTSRSATARRRLLDDLKTWMAANNAAIMAVLCLVIGAKLIGDGISGLG